MPRLFTDQAEYVIPAVRSGSAPGFPPSRTCPEFLHRFWESSRKGVSQSIQCNEEFSLIRRPRVYLLCFDILFGGDSFKEFVNDAILSYTWNTEELSRHKHPSPKLGIVEMFPVVCVDDTYSQREQRAPSQKRSLQSGFFKISSLWLFCTRVRIVLFSLNQTSVHLSLGWIWPFSHPSLLLGISSSILEFYIQSVIISCSFLAVPFLSSVFRIDLRSQQCVPLLFMSISVFLFPLSSSI